MSLTGNPSLVDPGFDYPPSNPIILFQHWLKNTEVLNVNEPYDIVLSTVDALQRPSSRVVLLKEINLEGIIFASSETSQKGQDLLNNSWAAGTLWWRETMQQINLQGKVSILDEKKSDSMFYERPREAQAISAVSLQSALLDDEKLLREKMDQLIHNDKTIIRPKNWHAYQLNIETIEFWHGGKDRFHKRLRYDRIDNKWLFKRLQP